MKNLKNSNLYLLFILICGCQSTQSFKIRTDEEKELHVVEIESNRIIQECYFMNAEKENNWRHQYVLYMLNEKNEVIPAFYPTNQDIDDCTSHLKKVERVLKNSARVKLCVRDKLEKVADTSTYEFHDFGKLGAYKSTYHALTFDSICNSRECYDISDTWTYTCPDFKK